MAIIAYIVYKTIVAILWFHYGNVSNDRTPLDRRRLENAHLRFAVLSIQNYFPEIFTDTVITSDIQDTLKEINQNFPAVFRKTYSGMNKSLVHIKSVYCCILQYSS